MVVGSFIEILFTGVTGQHQFRRSFIPLALSIYVLYRPEPGDQPGTRGASGGAYLRGKPNSQIDINAG